MRCNRCGKELIGNEEICPSCGAKIIHSDNQNSYINVNNNQLENNNLNPVDDMEIELLDTHQTEFNSQKINENEVNQLQSNNTNSVNIQNNQNINNNISNQQNFTVTGQIDDEELLKAFIGNNYVKITTKPFNFAGFFFTTLYMYYRKMFGYAFLTFLLNLIVLVLINVMGIVTEFAPIARNSASIFAPMVRNIASIAGYTLVFNIAIGLLVNKIYVFYAKKKISKIKASNSQKNSEELKSICSVKGGTSVGKVFLGIFVEIITIFTAMIISTAVYFGHIKKSFEHSKKSFEEVTKEINKERCEENVSVTGYSCFGSKCNITIEDSLGNTSVYDLDNDNSELISILGDYKDYIKLDVYYTIKGNIVDYKIFLKSNNEDISNVKTESELRQKIGLYSIGNHTGLFTLSKIGTTGFGIEGNKSYSYISYTFVDNKNIEYEMEYRNVNNTLNLVEGNKYNITFEVSEDTFGYKYTIKSIK